MTGRKILRTCIYFLSLLLALVPVLHAKEKTQEGWLPISPEDLALKDNPADPGASAMILYREVKTDDVAGFETHYVRIKILTDEGKKYADVEIPYIEKAVEIQDVRARTVRPDGSVVEFQGQMFDQPIIKAKGVRFQAKTFALSDAQKGSIIEYSYRVKFHPKWPDVLKDPGSYIITSSRAFPTAHWEIQHDLFTRRAYFSIRPLATATLKGSWGGLPPGKSPQQKPDKTVELEVEAIPGFREEEYMPPEGALKSRVDLFYTIGFLGTYEGFWGDQGKWLGETYEKFIGNHKEMKREVERIVAPNDQPETKLRKLYDRVQKIRYLYYEPAKSHKEEKRENLKENKSVDDVLKHGYASANEINLLFVALVRAAGFDAAVDQVAPRDRIIFQRNLLDVSQLSVMVVRVRFGSTDTYFDAATRFCPFKFLPWNETGTAGIELGPSSGKLVNTPTPPSAEAIVERKALLQLNTDGSVGGELRVNFVGQEALQRRLANYERDDAGRRKALQDDVKESLPPGATVELTKAPDWERSNESLYTEFKFKIPTLGTQTSHRLILPLAILWARDQYPFQHIYRIHPVYFDYPYQKVDEITVQLPAGYRVEALPAPQKVVGPSASYELSCQDQGNTVKINRRLVIDQFSFPLKQYSGLSLFFRNVRKGDEGLAVLRVAGPDVQK